MIFTPGKEVLVHCEHSIEGRQASVPGCRVWAIHKTIGGVSLENETVHAAYTLTHIKTGLSIAQEVTYARAEVIAQKLSEVWDWKGFDYEIGSGKDVKQCFPTEEIHNTCRDIARNYEAEEGDYKQFKRKMLSKLSEDDWS